MGFWGVNKTLIATKRNRDCNQTQSRLQPNAIAIATKRNHDCSKTQSRLQQNAITIALERNAHITMLFCPSFLGWIATKRNHKCNKTQSHCAITIATKRNHDCNQTQSQGKYGVLEGQKMRFWRVKKWGVGGSKNGVLEGQKMGFLDPESQNK